MTVVSGVEALVTFADREVEELIPVTAGEEAVSAGAEEAVSAGAEEAVSAEAEEAVSAGADEMPV